jgi:HK97 family phage prohead protease
MSIERRFTPNNADEFEGDTPCQVELRESSGDGPPKITGYAAVFYVEGDPSTEYELMPGLRERIMPRAFNRALKDKDDVRGLFNHNPDKILGRTASKTMKLWKDQRGLRYEIDPPNSSEGASAVESIRRGDVDGSSFAFTVDDKGQKFRRITNEDGSTVDIREIHSVHTLFDVGPVVYPAFKASSVGMRSADADQSELRSAYEAWKKEQSGEDDAEKRVKEEQEREARLTAIRQRAESLET